MTDEHTTLKDDLDRVPALGNVERALTQGARVRRRRILVTAAVAVVAIGGFGATLTIAGTVPSVSPVAPSDDQVGLFSDIVVGEKINEWVPEIDLVGAPAPVGTAVATTCVDTSCVYSLVNGNSRINLETVSPDLVRVLDEVGVGSTSLSNDGRYLSIPLDNGIRIQPLDPASDELPITIGTQTSGSTWSLVAWGSGSLNASLVETDESGTPIRYGLLDVLARTITSVSAGDAPGLVPVGHFGIGPYLAPADTPADGSRIDLSVLSIGDEKGYLKAGQVEEVDANPVDVSGLVEPGETVLGPGGDLEVRIPAGANDDTSWPRLTIFDARQDGGDQTAIIVLERNAPYRIDLPSRCRGRNVLVEVRPGTFACTVQRDSTSILQFAGEEVASVAVRGVTTWLVPGQGPSS